MPSLPKAYWGATIIFSLAITFFSFAFTTSLVPSSVFLLASLLASSLVTTPSVRWSRFQEKGNFSALVFSNAEAFELGLGSPHLFQRQIQKALVNNLCYICLVRLLDLRVTILRQNYSAGWITLSALL